MLSIIPSILSLLINLIPECPALFEDDRRSLIETLTGFEIIYTEGLDTSDTAAALANSIEDAQNLLDEVKFYLDGFYERYDAEFARMA